VSATDFFTVTGSTGGGFIQHHSGAGAADFTQNACGFPSIGWWGGVHHVSPVEAYFAGGDGEVCRWTADGGFQPMNAGPTVPDTSPNSIQKLANGRIVWGDGDGFLFELDGGAIPLPSTNQITDFVGALVSDGTGGFWAGVGPRIHHQFADGGWAAPFTTAGAVRGIHQVSPGDVWAAATSAVYRFDGGQWSAVTVPGGGGQWRAVWASPQNVILGGGLNNKGYGARFRRQGF
jgi:hypothetical protein